MVDDWLDALDADSADQVLAALTILREVGPALGRPLVDTVTGSRHKNMKELRPGSRGRSELRVLFKAGNWTKWYRTNFPLADDLLDQHNQALRDEEGRR